ncbi:MAG: hypothetical protein U1A27_09805 [Phycisphaerae bacterium]
MQPRRRRAAFIVLLAFPWAGSGLATPPRAPPHVVPVTLNALPADTLAVLFCEPLRHPARPAASSAPTSDTELSLGGMLELAHGLGLVSSDNPAWSDLLGSLPLLGNYRFAVALLDVLPPPATQIASGAADSAVPALQAALVIETRGDNDALLAAIDRVVSRYTNSQLAQLSAPQYGRYEAQRLVDRRNPDWAVVEWLAMDDLFAVTIGDGAAARLVAAYGDCTPGRALHADPWLQQSFERAAPRDLPLHGAPAPLVGLYFNHARSAARLAPDWRDRQARALAALGSSDLLRELWRFDRVGRELRIARVSRGAGADRLTDYTPVDAVRSPPASRVPAAAQHVAVIRTPVGPLVRHVADAIVATRSTARAAGWRRFWQQLERDAGSDLDTVLLDNLGGELIVCDFPRHPLELPFALTLVAPLRDADAFRAALERVLAAWGAKLAPAGKGSLFRLALDRTTDGIWYLRLGLAGPAVKVARRHVIVSWSPQALREALAQFEPESR